MSGSHEQKAETKLDHREDHESSCKATGCILCEEKGLAIERDTAETKMERCNRDFRPEFSGLLQV